MWIRIFHLAPNGGQPIECDCIGTVIEVGYNDNNFENNYDRLVFTCINKTNTSPNNWEISTHYIYKTEIVVVQEINKPSLIPNLNEDVMHKLQHDLGKKFQPIKRWTSTHSAQDKELFIAEVDDIKSVLYADVLNELAHNVRTYIGEDEGLSKNEKSTTIRLLLDDGKVKEKYEIEFYYVRNSMEKKLDKITIDRITKETYTYPVVMDDEDADLVGNYVELLTNENGKF